MWVRSVAYEGGRGEYAKSPLFETKMYKILYFMRKITKINNIFIQFSFQSGSIRVKINFWGASGAILREKSPKNFAPAAHYFLPGMNYQIYLVFHPLPFGNF